MMSKEVFKCVPLTPYKRKKFEKNILSIIDNKEFIIKDLMTKLLVNIASNYENTEQQLMVRNIEAGIKLLGLIDSKEADVINWQDEIEAIKKDLK
jgi:hypothetical protein